MQTNKASNVDILKDCLSRLHEIKYGRVLTVHSQHASELALSIRCRILYRTIKWKKDRDSINEKIMFYNVIFLNRFKNYKYM
jgi:hypothetical protein